MARRLRPVELDFVRSAPVRLAFSAEVSASAEAVYHALAEDLANTPAWFTPVVAARPTRDGAGREVRLRGGVVFQETIMARDPGARYAYRVDETNAPGLRALLEEWLITPAVAGARTRVRWTMAVDGTVPLRLTVRAAGAGMGRSFHGAMRNLDRRLATAPPR
ncbi:SRPBCC family protein [Streptomyces sp. NPDC001941]|uniref:SRPBCC family protein n=1 Tax=Streptomyces sp. NPDC001941 TaxID=3154659 RepID=UPI003334550F